MTTLEAQGALKIKKAYKVMSNAFESQNKAIEAVLGAKAKGFTPQITIENNKYKILYAEKQTRAEAENLEKLLKEKKIDAAIVEI